MATLIALTMIGTVLGAPIASAEPVDVTDATFEWSISEEVGSKAPPFGGCNYLSAGASDGSEGAYLASEGDVEIARIDGATPTWATRCDGVGSEFQKVVWSGGTGTVDPETGEATLAFTGEFSINFYGGLVPFTIQDPVLTVDDTGAGQLVATMYGWESSMEDPNVKVPVDPVDDIVVADLGDVDVAGTGFTVTPDYEGVEYTPPAGSDGTPQNRTTEGWGSWPASFVDFHYLTGLTSYWYSSGGAADPYKSPTPITFGYSDVGGGGDPEPGDGEQIVTVVVPEVTEPGEFLWSIEDDGAVTLTEAANQGTYLQSTGEIDPIVVTDTRDGGPEWSISGQVSDFGAEIPANYLGWSPKIIAEGAGAVAGSVVDSGIGSGDGLSVASILAAGAAGHEEGTATLGADLDLRLPVDTEPGTYAATLTITALS